MDYKAEFYVIKTGILENYVNKMVFKRVVTMPIRTVSEANQREHWGKKVKRKNSQKRDFHLMWGNFPTRTPCRVVFTRFSCRTLDKDNLAGAFKHVQDAMAEILGIDDGSKSVTWEYRQKKIPNRDHYITVEYYS